MLKKPKGQSDFSIALGPLFNADTVLKSPILMGQKNQEKRQREEKLCHNSVGERGRGRGREDPGDTKQSRDPRAWDLLQL